MVVGGGGGRGKEGGFDLGFGNFLRTIVCSGFSKQDIGDKPHFNVQYLTSKS